MKMKRRGGRGGGFGGTGKNLELQTDNPKFKLFAQKNLNIKLFWQGNLSIFIASIYMESRKALKERMRMVCCPCYGKR